MLAKHNLLTILSLGAVFGGCKTARNEGSETLNASGEKRPNILLVVTDDQRYDAFGAMQRQLQAEGKPSLAPWLKTPTLDHLAATGVTFRNAYVSLALCSPTRSVLMTGMYSHRNGVVHNSQLFTGKNNKKNWPTIMGSRGYRTGFFGKWHHSNQVDTTWFGTFDSYATYPGHGTYMGTVENSAGGPRGPYDELGKFNRDYKIRKTDDIKVPVEPNGKDPWYVDDIIADAVIDFFTPEASGDHAQKPWVAMVGFKTPHEISDDPRWNRKAVPPARTASCYQNKKLENVEKVKSIHNKAAKAPWLKDNGSSVDNDKVNAYYRSVSGVDGSLHKILKALNETGQAANTLVIFTSDNGYYHAEHGLVDKRSAYEESVRVPFIVNYPALMGQTKFDIEDEPFSCDKSGKEQFAGKNLSLGSAKMVSQFTINTDIAPTLLDFAGISPKELDTDGESIKTLVQGQSQSSGRDAIMMAYHYDPEYPTAVPPFVSVRDKEFKLVRFPTHDPKGKDEGDDQLFDLNKDPFEVHNLIKDPKYQTQKEALDKKMQELKTKHQFCHVIPKKPEDYFRQIRGGGDVPMDCVDAEKVYEMYKSRG
jgi:arylsulfatase A-like enzyme